jgi:SAM-dependent methyltransferase
MAERRTLSDVYDNPYYYEIAFGFRDIRKEVDFFEQCIGKWSKIPVTNVLEIGCGPSPYMLELAKRGYVFAGLDLSKAMLDYSLAKAKKAKIRMKTIHADMRDFRIKEKFDFAFCMLGSIEVESNIEFLSHLDSVAACLGSGGLYLVDASIQFDWSRLGAEYWTMLKDDLTVNVSWATSPVCYTEQKIKVLMTIEVISNEETKTFKTEKICKLVFPQEFKELVKESGKFEFLGWYNNLDLTKPLEKMPHISRPVTLLRRK